MSLKWVVLLISNANYFFWPKLYVKQHSYISLKHIPRRTYLTHLHIWRKLGSWVHPLYTFMYVNDNYPVYNLQEGDWELISRFIIYVQ